MALERVNRRLPTTGGSVAAGDEAFIAAGGGAQAQPAARALGAPSPSGLPGKRALRQRCPSPTVLPNSPLRGQPPHVPLCAQTSHCVHRGGHSPPLPGRSPRCARRGRVLDAEASEPGEQSPRPRPTVMGSLYVNSPGPRDAQAAGKPHFSVSARSCPER